MSNLRLVLAAILFCLAIPAFAADAPARGQVVDYADGSVALDR